MADAPPLQRGDIVVYIKHLQSVPSRIGSVGIILKVADAGWVLQAKWIYAPDDSLEEYDSQGLSFNVLEKVGHIDLP